MAFCKECGAEIGTAKFCPECGAAQVEAPKTEAKAQKAEKKKGFSCITFLAALGLVALGLVVVVFALGGSGSSTPSYVPRTTTHRVTYRITGTAREIDLTFNNAQGNTEQIGKATVPWSKAYESFPSGEFAYVSAQNQGKSGSVKCDIFVDGVIIESAESSGEYVIATCSGIVR